jgi:D-lactate dehydrogenase (cytochrome)
MYSFLLKRDLRRFASSLNHLQFHGKLIERFHFSQRQHNDSHWWKFLIFSTFCSLSVGEAHSETHTSDSPVNQQVFSSLSLSINSSSGPNYDEFFQELSKVLPADQIDQTLSERQSRGKAWNSYHQSTVFPRAIIYPTSTQEVSAIVRLCHQYHVPIVAFGGGTSLEGQTLTLFEGISLDFSRMQKIISFHETDLDISVEAGLGYIDLNTFLQSYGLWFPLDPGPGASLGGMAACRCSGSTAVRYGSMRENVLSLTVILSDGTIVSTSGNSRARKSSAGYDLTRLMIGSEGTLGIITELTLKLHPIPKVSYAVRISYPNIPTTPPTIPNKNVNASTDESNHPSGIYRAACTARDSLHCGVQVGRCELLDDTMLQIVNASYSTPNNLENHTPFGIFPKDTTLLYEVTGVSESVVEAQVAILSQIAHQYGANQIDIYRTPNICKQLWQVRKECLWLAMSQYPGKEPLITDVCVPLSNLPILIEETKIELAKSSLPCPIVAHAGNLNNFFIL